MLTHATAFTFTAFTPSLVDDARDRELAAGRAVVPADDGGRFPVRCCLRDVDRASEVVLLSMRPPTAESPYAADSPVYIHRHRCAGYRPDGSVPEVLRDRLLSLRAYTADHMLTGTAVEHGRALGSALDQLFAGDGTAYVFAHFAGPGCYACRIDRVAS
jgi:hypothetical protein